MKKTILLLFVLAITVNTDFYAQLPFSKSKDDIFEIENIEEVSAKHKKIAVLPFRTLITYQHPEIRVESQLEQVNNQLRLSYMWQVALHERITKRSKKLSVEIQEIQETNKILLDHDYFRNFNKYSPIDLCEILDVDAIVFSTYDLSLNNDESTLLGAGLTELAAAAAATSNIPGVSNLSSQMIKDMTTDPGGFVNKLKSGDLNELISMTAGAVGFDPKLATVLVANSGTVIKLAKGETDNLLQDVLINNASLIGDQLGGNDGEMVANLIKKNATTIQNIVDGEVENLFTDLVSNNLSAMAGEFGGADGVLISNIISNNSSLIKNVVNGDTSNLFQQILANNANLIGEKIGGNNAQLYTNLIINNQTLIKDIASGNTTELLQNLLTNNMNTLGEQIGSEEVSKYVGMISANKDLVKGMIAGDMTQIKSKLLEQGTELLGAQLSNSEIGEFSSILTGNKELVQSFVNGDTSGIVNNALSQAPDLLGVNLDIAQIQQFSNLVGQNKDLVSNLTSGNVSDIVGGTLSKISSGKLSLEQSNELGQILTANPEILGIISAGNTANLTSKIKQLIPEVDASSISEYTEFLTSNKNELTQLFEVNVAEVEKVKNFMNPEMITNLAQTYGADQNFMGGMLSGDSNIMVDQLLRSEELKSLGLDASVMNNMAGIFLKSRGEAAEILASGAVEFYALTGELTTSNFSIEVEEEDNSSNKKKNEKMVIKKKKFFNKVTDFALTNGTNAGKTNASERIGNFLSGSKGDIGSTSFSIFDGATGGLTWNYVEVEENTNVYDIEKSLDRFARKFTRKLPYMD
ncbi:hypothetical protein O4H26_05285 [Aequorivita viscosa]|nr:hypothetical protein [Aequorivita viscosa]